MTQLKEKNPVMRDAERAHVDVVEDARYEIRNVGPCKGARSMYCEVQCIDLIEDGRTRPATIYQSIVDIFGDGSTGFLRELGVELVDGDFPTFGFGSVGAVECAKRSLVFAFQEELYERVGAQLMDGGSVHYYTLETLSKQPREALTIRRRMKVLNKGREAYRAALRTARQVYREACRED